MRTLPVALAYGDAEQMAVVGARLSAMTHWDPQAEVCCLVYCFWIRRLMSGQPRQEAWEAALEDTQQRVKQGRLAPDTPGPTPLPPDFWPRLRDIESKSYAQLQPSSYAGYVVECLEAAVWCVLHADNAEEAITEAANLAGEADTIAAVAGGAAGACWGQSALPTRWLDTLHQRSRLEQVAVQIAALRRHHAVYATPGLKPFAYRRPTDRVYTGRHPLTARDVAVLQSLGITHVLDLREDAEWTAPGKFGQEAPAALAAAGMMRCSVPIPDATAPSADALEAAYRFLSAALADPAAQVYVHCRAGRERTGAVLLAWLCRNEGRPIEAVLPRLHEFDIRPMPAQRDAVRSWLHSDKDAS